MIKTYINKNITGYKNRIAILGKTYKLDDSQQKDLTEFIEDNVEESKKMEVYKNYSKNYNVVDGKVYYK